MSCTKCNGLSALGIGGCSKCHGTGKAKQHKKSKSHGSKKKNKSKPNPKWKDKYNGAKYYKPKRHKYPCHGHKVIRLYHQTDKKGALAIKSSKQMIRGGTGMFGGGVYFAETKKDTFGKAHNKGWMIIADVFVGKEKWAMDNKAGQFTFQSLYKQGYDSVYAPKGAGTGPPERVVYNYDQVRIIKVYKI